MGSEFMKKYIAFILLSMASVASYADYKPGYYDAMDGKTKEDLKQAARACVEKHTMLNYSNLPNYWIVSDVYPEL